MYWECLGRIVLVTNRAVGSVAEVVAVYGQLQHVERVVPVVEMARPADGSSSNLKVHAFRCILGVSPLQHSHRRARVAWRSELTPAQLCAEFREVQQVDPLTRPGTGGIRHTD